MTFTIMTRASRMSVPKTLMSTSSRNIRNSFSTSTAMQGDIGKDKTHVTRKEDGHKDIQSEASKSGQEERANPTGTSQATSEKDLRNNNKRAEEEHPEAPKPVIGMNEERGKSGY